MPRVPAPTPAKLAKGETRPSRVNFEAPEPPTQLTDPPADMTPEAKVVWRQTVRAMRTTRVLTTADTNTLRIYCDIVVRYRKAHAQLYASTPLLTTSKRRGEVIRNPLNAVVRDLMDAHRLYARELGLTPSARASLHMDPGAYKANMDDIIGPPPKLRAV